MFTYHTNLSAQGTLQWKTTYRLPHYVLFETRTHLHRHACMHAHTHAQMHACTCAHSHVPTYPCMHARTHRVSDGGRSRGLGEWRCAKIISHGHRREDKCETKFHKLSCKNSKREPQNRCGIIIIQHVQFSSQRYSENNMSVQVVVTGEKYGFFPQYFTHLFVILVLCLLQHNLHSWPSMKNELSNPVL